MLQLRLNVSYPEKKTEKTTTQFLFFTTFILQISIVVKNVSSKLTSVFKQVYLKIYNGLN